MSVISEEQIRRRAFEIWEAQGRPQGCDVQHWLQAEHELNGSEDTTASAAPAAGPAAKAAKSPAKAAAKTSTAKPSTAKPSTAKAGSGKAPARPRKATAKA